MRASHPAAAVLFLVAAASAWYFRRWGEDAELVAAGLAIVCVCGAVSSLLRRRLVSGLCALVAGVALAAATGVVGEWLVTRARLGVGLPLGCALVALAVGEPEKRA